DSVLLDKTGTLTLGRPELTDVVALDGDEQALLSLVASAQKDSEHPVARALVAGARKLGAAVLPPESFQSAPGRGVTASVAGRESRVGTAAWLTESDIDAAPLEARAEEIAAAGRTPS